MAKKERATLKLYFIKYPPRTGYHPGKTEDVPEEMAKEFIKDGYARLATETLPNDLPGRDELMKAGIEELDEVKALAPDTKALTDIKYIGDATAQDIQEYFGIEPEADEE